MNAASWQHLRAKYSADIPGKAILLFLFYFLIKGLHLKCLHNGGKTEEPEVQMTTMPTYTQNYKLILPL